MIGPPWHGPLGSGVMALWALAKMTIAMTTTSTNAMIPAITNGIPISPGLVPPKRRGPPKFGPPPKLGPAPQFGSPPKLGPAPKPGSPPKFGPPPEPGSPELPGDGGH